MKPAILFFDLPGVGHLQVVRRVVASGHPAVVNSPPLARALRAEGIPFHFWSDFQHDAVLARARERATCVAAELDRLLQDPGRRRAAFSPGCDEILRQAGGLFVERLLALIQDEVAAIEIFERLARDLPLGLLVLGCDNAHAQRALIGAARRRAIPSLQLAHGMVSPPACGRVAAEMYHGFSDHIAVYGRRAEALLVAMGVAVERIHRVGDPLADDLFAADAQLAAADARERLSLDPGRPVVALLSSYSDGSSPLFALESRRRLEIHRAVARALSEHSVQPTLLIRAHPNELARYPINAAERRAASQGLVRWFERLGVRDVRVVGDRKVELIRAADLVLVEGESTSAGEAMILDRPVVLLPRLLRGAIYRQSDGVHLGEDPELPEIVKRLLADPAYRAATLAKQRQALSELYEGADGNAGERTAALIAALAERSAHGRELSRSTLELGAP